MLFSRRSSQTAISTSSISEKDSAAVLESSKELHIPPTDFKDSEISQPPKGKIPKWFRTGEIHKTLYSFNAVFFDSNVSIPALSKVHEDAERKLSPL